MHARAGRRQCERAQGRVTPDRMVSKGHGTASIATPRHDRGGEVMNRRSTAALAALLLASCGGENGNEQAASGGTAGTNTAAGATATAGGGAAAVALQPGQWEITTAVLRM